MRLRPDALRQAAHDCGRGRQAEIRSHVDRAGATIVARLQYSLTFDDMASTANALPFIGKEWEREVDDYFHFIDDTLNELVRSPFVRLDVQLG